MIAVPPLRERIEDVPILASYFAQYAVHGHDSSVTLSTDAMLALQEHDWPGNVRELKHMVERVIALAGSPVISAANVHAQSGVRPSVVEALPGNDRRRAQLREVLISVEWDTGRAAAVLGVDRTTVYRRMNRLGIALPMRRGDSTPAGGNA